VSSPQIKNSFHSIGELDVSISPSALILKLSATRDSLRYFVVSQTHQQVIFFGDYTLHHITTPGALATAIDKIFEKDEILELPFAKVLIGFDETYSLVPRELSSVLVSEGNTVTRCADTDILFEGAVEVVAVLKKLFPNSELLHLNSTYLHLLPEYLNDSGQKLFVNVAQKYFDTIYFKEKSQLQLMNRYDYRAASDFIYFLLLCCEELKIDRNSCELVLLGEIDIQSKIYELCYRYFLNIRFIQKAEGINFSRAFDVYPKHVHFNLYNLRSCE
jgi:hypothetical protein